MYIDTKIYKNGILHTHQIMSYKDSEELKVFRELAETKKLKLALLSLNTSN